MKILLIICSFIISICFNNILYGQSLIKEGDIAPNFDLKSTDGKTISTSDFNESKGLIIVFTNSTCPYANLYNQRIATLYQKYVNSGFKLLAINCDKRNIDGRESKVDGTIKGEAFNISFPLFNDDNLSLAKSFGIQKIPFAYVLQKTKKGLTVKYSGSIDNDIEDTSPNSRTNYVEKAVDALLKNKNVELKQTDVNGCYIL
jgi:glutathione peroxidase-family protein